MNDDTLIEIMPDRHEAGKWRVGSKWDLTLEEAKVEVLRQMDEFVFVSPAPLTEAEVAFRRRWFETVVRPMLENDPYAGLIESKPFQS